MLAIKLKRVGKKHQVSYRLVVAEKKSKLSGRYVEDLGFYNPHTKEVKIDKEGVNNWIVKGAQPTETVNNLLIKNEVIEGDKIKAHSSRKRKKQLEREAKAKEATKAEAEKIEEVPVVEETSTESTPVEETPVVEEVKEEKESSEEKSVEEIKEEEKPVEEEKIN